MAYLKGENKKTLTVNPNSIFPTTSNKNSTTKSPKIFNPNGVVGLRIVAALEEYNHSTNKSTTVSISPKSNPIPIRKTKFGGPNLEEGEEMELSEEYTCVISHMGNNLVKKREYFDGVLANESETAASDWPAANKAAPVVFQTAEFLNSCYLCRKQLHGLDIFMYRGEKAFCSAECRCKQMAMDERKEKRGSGAMKPLDFSVSPCSSPMQFFAGVAAA